MGFQPGLPRLYSETFDSDQNKAPYCTNDVRGGSKSIEEIPDVVPSTFHNFSGVHKYINLGPQDMHLTLAAFGDSDILVTSPSGYSHLASLLCVKPRILALPFWHSYAALPNTLTELSIERNETGAIFKLDIPASFHYDCDA